MKWLEPDAAPWQNDGMGVLLEIDCGPHKGGRFIASAARDKGRWILPPGVEDNFHVEIRGWHPLPPLSAAPDRGG